jgi:uncharacterized lipoprotein YddW (UPF0748 family)
MEARALSTGRQRVPRGGMMGRMPITRRTFLQSAGAGATVLATGLARPAVEAKNWVWVPAAGSRRSADDWKRRLALLRESGVRAILPEIYDGRSAYFESKRLPVKTTWLETLLPLARAESVEVHAWMWCMPCMLDDIMKNHPDWYNVNAKGESAVDKPAYVSYYKFLDPGRPEVREFVQGTVKELAGISELTGIHLDYIRHPDAILPSSLWKRYGIVQDKVYPPYDYGYTEYERNQFKGKYGADPMSLHDPKLEERWLEFRWDMVTGLVNGYLVPAAHAKGKKITAAVFPGPTMARTMVMQDWGKWNLDAFLPMLYNQFYNAGPEWVAEQTREAVSTVKQPVYSGISVQGMTEAVFTRTVQLALEAGASGMSLFSDGGVDEIKLKALQKATAANARG